jgi:indolepyruvate ferredoxin oxidoreductase
MTHYRIICGSIASYPGKEEDPYSGDTNHKVTARRSAMTDLASRIEGGSVQDGPSSHVDYLLTDRYTKDQGRVFLSGVQALARIPLEQLRVDRIHGLNTAAFVSGYPGSPLAGFDREAAIAAKLAGELPYVAQPGLNEELAATAVMGSQLINTAGARYDGVVGVWYGKAPGLDRACDAIRHAVFTGTSRYGGVVALVGDDPSAKSSTLPSSSDATLVDLHIPILYPGDVQDAIDLGRHAIALSRASGLWTSLKIVAGVADGTGTVDLDLLRVQTIIPTMEVNGELWVPHPSGRLLGPATLAMEREFQDVRSELARRYGVENHLNRITASPIDPWIGIAACGYTYFETLAALRLLGLDTIEAVERAGIRLLQLRMPVPLDVGIVREFAHGLREIFVIEEKNPTLEWLIKDALYGWNERPVVVGKRNEVGERLIPANGHADADAIVGPLRSRLAGRLGDRLAPLPRKPRELIALSSERTPFFCSGCPHNTSTKVPDGALYGAGIGCHGMTMLMPEDRVGVLAGVGAMGNEGAQWIGMAPFVDTPHFIQNLGDGTFFHSGQLAIQFAIAAKANITYKLLYNGTVAMTGGQDAQGALDVVTVTKILQLQGVARVLITTDDVDRYAKGSLASSVEVWDRSRVVEAQEMLAKISGVTVLIHDQACAAENRRDRKRNLIPTPKFRVLINERVCEGCGDCGEKSNCLSVQPIDTPFGRKTHIDQTTCNFDYSCLQGDCPSFMTVELEPKASGKTVERNDVDLAVLSEPTRKVADDCTIRIPGIGGTGVVTVAQILGTAAMLGGRHVRGLDQTGLSQKAGVVVSDLQITTNAAAPTNKATNGSVDVLIAFDLLGAASDAQLSGASVDRTVVVGSTSTTATGQMVVHPDMAVPSVDDLRARINGVSRSAENVWIDAATVTEAIFGDTTMANILQVGVAYQSGLIPISSVEIERAIELNGVAVERNIAAFRYGRLWVVNPSKVPTSHPSDPGKKPVLTPVLSRSLSLRIEKVTSDAALRELLCSRTEDLIGYQSVAYASQYLSDVERIAKREMTVLPGSVLLTESVARYLHKLMAYKDEYEVARLLLLPESVDAVEAIGGSPKSLRWHLHPPMLRSLGMNNKLKLGQSFRPALTTLRKMKRLRGTPLDIFGYADLRKQERALINEYRGVVDQLLESLSPANIRSAAAIASLPDLIRGYEHRKVAAIARFHEALAASLAKFLGPVAVDS